LAASTYVSGAIGYRSARQATKNSYPIDGTALA
jgi:hypothetical protein